MRVAEFRAEDLAYLLEQGGQAFAGSRAVMLQPGYGEMLRSSGPAWTGWNGDTILGCGGIYREHENLATAWTLLNPVASGRGMVTIDRWARRVLDGCPVRRIQATTSPEFAAGRRWLELLGFTFEGIMQAYTPDGRDQALYSRVRKT